MLPASALPCPPMYLVSALIDEARADRLGPEQRRRGHRVVDDVENPALPWQARRSARDRRPACAGWRSSRRRRAASPASARARRWRRPSRRRTRCPAPCATSVLNWLTVLPNRNWLDDDVVALAQQREHHRADRRHAGREADGGHAVLHLRHLRLERGGGRIALPAVGIALRAALEHGGEIARVAIAVGDRYVQRLVQRAVLDAGIAVGVEDRGREARGGLVVSMGAPKTKTRSTSAERVWRVLRKRAGVQPNLALAEFVTRPQAEAQIGADQIITGASGFVNRGAIRYRTVAIWPRASPSAASAARCRPPSSAAASSGGSRFAGPAQVLLRKLAEEARGLAFDRFARAPPPTAERQMQALLRAGDADVEEPPLLVDVAVRDRLAVRQQPLLQPDQEHVGKLESLRRVQRRKPDRVRLASRPGPRAS